MMAWEVRYISKTIFDKQASVHNLLPLLLTTIPWNVGVILPMTSVLGGLLGTQHLSEGSELVASQGLGHGMRGFSKPWALLSLVLIICSIVNAHWISPWASRKEQQLLYDLAQEAALVGGYMPKAGEEPKLLKGDVFSQDFAGDKKGSPPLPDQTIYWGVSKDDGKLHIMQIGQDTVSHLISDRYSHKVEKVKVDFYDQFEHIQMSFRFEDVSGKAISKSIGLNERITDVSYKTFEVSQPIQIKKQSLYQPTALRHMDTGELLSAATSADATPNLTGATGVELFRRFSNPLACCSLLLLGIAIGLSHPRFYKGGALVKSIALILLYFIVVKVVEGWIESNIIDWTYVAVMLPLSFLAAGWLLLYKKMYPPRHGRHKKIHGLLMYCQGIWRKNFLSRLKKALPPNFSDGPKTDAVMPQHKFRDKIIARWTSKEWWKNFAGVLAIFVLFYLFIEFAVLAPYMAEGGGKILLFVKYWICKMPTILPFVLPVVFLLAWVLTFSDASVSREWTALRASGISLVQWVRGSWKAWGLAIIAAFIVEVCLSPLSYVPQNNYYRQIRGQKVQSEKNAVQDAEDQPTSLFLGSTGVFWYSEGATRWGFPLLPPDKAPSFIFWEHGQSSTRQLNWNASAWTPGVGAETLFPASSLRQYQRADEIPTLDLFIWQTWAPSADRGTLLWGRLLKWLAGPCLFFASLGFAFPPPRKGRGQALGYALILSLIFIWMQNLFEVASKAGQFPPLWGVLAPMFILVGFGLINLRRLHT